MRISGSSSFEPEAAGDDEHQLYGNDKEESSQPINYHETLATIINSMKWSR